jgi:hypothetical protein
MDWEVECHTDLILAVFRLAVADVTGTNYSHNGGGTKRRGSRQHCADARVFLEGEWGAELAEMIGLSSERLGTEVRRLRSEEGPARTDRVGQIGASWSRPPKELPGSASSKSDLARRQPVRTPRSQRVSPISRTASRRIYPSTPGSGGYGGNGCMNRRNEPDRRPRRIRRGNRRSR